MRCKCGGVSRVVNSRPRGHYVRRRRECMTCGARWTTYEFSTDDIQPIRMAESIPRAAFEKRMAAAKEFGQAVQGFYDGMAALRDKAERFWDGH